MRKKIVFTKNPATLPDPSHEDLKSETSKFLALQLQSHKHTRAVVESTLRSSISVAKNRSDSITAFHTHHVARLNAGYATVEELRLQLEKHLDTYYRDKKKIEAPSLTLPVKPALAVAVKLKVEGPDKHHVICTLAPSTIEATVGTLLVDDARFVVSGVQPKGALNVVYLRSDRAPREYIGYKHGADQLFVRRYVIRGLNQDDSYWLTQKKALKAVEATDKLLDKELATTDHFGRFRATPGATLTLGSQILSHTRGWSKRFVSTTLTNKPVISTLGKEFRSLFGAVLIDLAFVDPATIFDIHTPSSVRRYGLLGTDLIKVPSTKPSANRTIQDERELAVLDTVRTREVLIKGAVPYKAVRHKNCGSLIIGLYDSRSAYLANLRFDDVLEIWKSNSIAYESSERLPYRYIGFEWEFFSFSDATTAAQALSLAKKLINGITSPRNSGADPFDVFSFPDTMPTGAL
ncbi:MAG TPA: hypothetical protein VN156_16380 [Pseudomonas sp.]|nr:hypothetical protein [Pseudomonas sp.]